MSEQMPYAEPTQFTSEEQELNMDAYVLRKNHEDAVNEKKRAQRQFKLAKASLNVLQDEGQELLEEKGIKPGFRLVSELSDAGALELAHQLQKQDELTRNAYKEEETADKSRKAALWDAREHKEENLETYVSLAKKLAEQDGVEINTGDKDK